MEEQDTVQSLNLFRNDYLLLLEFKETVGLLTNPKKVNSVTESKSENYGT